MPVVMSMMHYVYAGCCNCLSRFKPRYKRLVDNIYPANPDDGLVRSNMEKLTYYAVSHNEKLNRIGKYLAQRLNRDIYRQQTNYVKISMVAVDELLLACHSQGLNLFVKSLLSMIDKLLEVNNAEYQLLATNSFVKFANIEEDAPSYDRNYDFLISQFSSMCYSDHDDLDIKKKIRVAGLKGLRGIVKKTVSDDLQYNIWEKQNMDKIIPSFLFNMQEGFGSQESPRHDQGEERPEVLAETCLRNLMGCAAYNNIHAVLKPVLKHLDLHTLWVPNDFAVKVFKVVMYSMQSQYLYVVPHFLLLHLDEDNQLTTNIKQSIVQILKETVAIAADGAVGSSVLEIFNSLLRHLRMSVDMRLSGGKGNTSQTKAVSNYNEKGEIEFEEAIIDTMGAFASILPDYQKIEIMMFIMGKVPLPNSLGSALPLSGGEGDVLLLNMLLKSLLEVGRTYSTVSMVTTFPASFLQPLLSVSIVADPGVRLIVQEILHTLMDRHENIEKFKCNRNIPRDISELNLNVEKPSRQDILFMRRSGHEIMWHLYKSIQFADNKKSNYIALYTTLGLLSVELGTEDTLVDLFKLTIALQDFACSSDNKLPAKHRCAVHALVARYLNLLGQLTSEPALCQHISSVIESRQESYPQLLPPINLDNNQTSRNSLPAKIPTEMLFQKETLCEALSNSGHDTSRFLTPFRQELNVQERPGKTADIGSVHLEVESTHPSPLTTRKVPAEEITFASFKSIYSVTVVDNHSMAVSDDDRIKRQKLRQKFQNSTLEQLATEADQRNKKLQSTMQSILDSVVKSPVSPAGSPLRPDPTSPFQFQSVPTYEMAFPELTVY
ncbi:Protein EFR3-like B [Holothuria leucospilota]|uniref:Protein EFR3-like B n=1 Tax=Holothuria leucospilota TaxID=206669 RepID=A0A9Q1C616_HOLLE|nr:Protein EFR3-like B [Holothuria leucospilota]